MEEREPNDGTDNTPSDMEIKPKLLNVNFPYFDESTPMHDSSMVAGTADGIKIESLEIMSPDEEFKELSHDSNQALARKPEKRKQSPLKDELDSKMTRPSNDDQDLSDEEEIFITVQNIPKHIKLKNCFKEYNILQETESFYNGGRRDVKLTFENVAERDRILSKLKEDGVNGKKVSIHVPGQLPEIDDDKSNITKIIARSSSPKPDVEDPWYADPLGYFGLKPEFLKSLDIVPPLDRWVHVTNFRCDKFELRDVMELAGHVVSCSVINNKKRFAKVQYTHPLEAIQAVSILNGQMYFGQQLKIRMDRNLCNDIILPKGLLNVGTGLGLDGKPLRDIVIEYKNFIKKRDTAVNPMLFRKYGSGGDRSKDNGDHAKADERQHEFNQSMFAMDMSKNDRLFKIKHVESLGADNDGFETSETGTTGNGNTGPTSTSGASNLSGPSQSTDNSGGPPELKSQFGPINPNSSRRYSGPKDPEGPFGSSGPIRPAHPRGYSGPMHPSDPRGFSGLINPAGPHDYSGSFNPTGPRGYSGPIEPAGPHGYSGTIELTSPRNYSGPLNPAGYSGSRSSGRLDYSGPHDYTGPIDPAGPRSSSGPFRPPGPRDYSNPAEPGRSSDRVDAPTVSETSGPPAQHVRDAESPGRSGSSSSNSSGTCGQFEPSDAQASYPTKQISPVRTDSANFVSESTAAPIPARMSAPIPARLTAPIPAPVPGPVRGPMAGPMPGPMLGPMAGPMPGPMPGLMPGPMPAPPFTMPSPNHNPNQVPMPRHMLNPIRNQPRPGPFLNYGPSGPSAYEASGKVTLQISNLPPSTTFPFLCNKLTNCGQLLSMQFTTAGTALVTFGHPSHADICYKTFNGLNAEGHTIVVNFV